MLLEPPDADAAAASVPIANALTIPFHTITPHSKSSTQNASHKREEKQPRNKKEPPHLGQSRQKVPQPALVGGPRFYPCAGRCRARGNNGVSQVGWGEMEAQKHGMVGNGKSSPSTRGVSAVGMERRTRVHGFPLRRRKWGEESFPRLPETPSLMVVQDAESDSVNVVYLSSPLRSVGAAVVRRERA